jgi:MATE family multidrug resistance protein
MPAISMQGEYRRVLKLAIPIVLANLTQPLLSMVDTGIAGHFADVAALGGVALGGLIFSFIFWGLGFLRMSTTGLIAQAYGAGDELLLRHVLWRASSLALFLGALILLLQAPLITIASAILTDRPGLLEQARLYCHARIWSAPLALCNYVFLGYLLGVQRVRAALMLQILVNLVNALAALMLVYLAHLGVAGLGAASAVADASGFVLGLLVLCRSNAALMIAPSLRALLEAVELKRLVVLNINLFGRTMCLLAVFAWFTRSSATVSVAALAGNTVLLNFQTFMAYGLDGFANACEAMVGAAIGARDRLQLVASIRSSTALAGLVALVFALTYGLFGASIIRLLTDLESVRAEAIAYLPFAVISPLISVWGFQFDGVFIGATRTRDLFFAMILSSALFAVSLAVLSPLGNTGLWSAFMIFMASRGLSLLTLLPRLVRSVPLRAP